ncbi:tetratricopeptide repeat protein [Wolbachia endosymbiont of Ctenocephalides felis wCfeJ]|uniref:tetratricopeptide repeat protein n=1 Tax=Wolbachia endosymbiont of Ctenocephalides felis wCfeJ TaxID=2732594 RepID=UPI0014475A1C|nr:tetratricopeptide repeat protein [Wolbachia endosymbiont of Ctenocephalides felis wCfeJ]WCR58332.1 MAG: Photosystem I assembly protein Ycf3 [Wolbachia endosymbiont of Ctenocephalides felis wCfeJ]
MREIDQELFDAVEEGNLSKVRECLKKGADIGTEDDYGITPVDFAKQEGHREIVGYLLFSTAKMLSEQGKYNKAQQAYQEALDIQKVVLGPNHSDTLDTRHNMAVVLEKQGKYSEALEIYQTVFDIQKRKDVLGPNHPYALMVRHNMAVVLSKQGKYSEAFNLYREVFEKRKDVLGPDHPDTLDTRHNMAVVLEKQGKYSEALEIYQTVFDIQKRKDVLGPNHPDTLMTRHNMASTLDDQGKYSEAFNLYQEVLEKRRDVLGPNHPGTLMTRDNMAGVLEKQGKYSKALEIYQTVFEKRRDVLGPDHPDTLRTRHGIAVVLKNQGKYSEALEIYQTVFEKRRDVLGPNHPDTLSTRHNMAAVLFEQNKYSKALRIFREVLDIQKAKLGLNHPDTLLTNRNIDVVLGRQKRQREQNSDNYKPRAASSSSKPKEVQSTDREYRDEVIEKVNSVLRSYVDRPYESLDILNTLLEKAKNRLGSRDYCVLGIRHSIAVVLVNALGINDEALKILQEILIIQKEELGSDHPSTLITSRNIEIVRENMSIRSQRKLQSQDDKCPIQSTNSNKAQQEKFLHSISNANVIRVKQGLYWPSFEERNVKIDGKCVAITRGLSQALLSQSGKSFLSNLKTSAKIYERIAQGKQISKREEREAFALSRLLNNFEGQQDSATNSLPSKLIHTQGYKTFSELSSYIAGIKGDFAIHLVTNNHVVAIYRVGDSYAYFDSNAAFVSEIKNVEQLMKVVEKGIKSAGYEMSEKGFLVEHFDVAKANSQLSNEDKQILAKEIKTERQLLAEQDRKFGLIKINGQEISRVQLYDFGTKIRMEGGVPLLISADMNLSSKKFQEHLDRKEVSMTARDYLDSLKNGQNMEEVVQATKVIPFIGSRREIEEAEKTRRLKQSLSELAKGAVNHVLATVALTSVSQSETKTGGPVSGLSGVTVDEHLNRAHGH